MRVESLLAPRAQHVELQTKRSKVIVYGTVTRVGPGRWNSQDGKEWVPQTERDCPAIYRTFYVDPLEEGTDRNRLISRRLQSNWREFVYYADDGIVKINRLSWMIGALVRPTPVTPAPSTDGVYFWL